MFSWRKKNQGFEWHQYVRTTIKHRRDDRRQRVEKVKKDAIEGVKGAGKAGVAAGARGAKAAWSGILAMPGAAMARFAPGITHGFGRGTDWVRGTMSRTVGSIADVIGGIYDSLPPVGTQLAKPGVRSLLCLFGLVAAGSGAVRVQTVGSHSTALRSRLRGQILTTVCWARTRWCWRYCGTVMDRQFGRCS
jgi:hypothetical protein